jgi:NodT family efflux transporter outer membrane factor (OMF) lipoprotein
MNHLGRKWVVGLAAAPVAALLSGGCMVGPDYKAPDAPIADAYREQDPTAVERNTADLAKWWTILNDPVLDKLVQSVYEQNPTLQVAGVRVLEAQARRGIAVGLMFPQQQDAFGNYTRNYSSKNQALSLPGDRSFDDWQLGAAAAWELDVWGRFRRGIESADADVLAAVANYDDVLVTLIGDVLIEYVNLRVLQERLAVVTGNVEVQKRGLEIAEARFRGGTATDLDRSQALTLLRDTEANVPRLQSQIIVAENRICTLMGIPPRDLSAMLGDNKTLPNSPEKLAVGIPADLLRRRPDIRRAERNLAAQSAQIGVAKSDLYPHFSLIGSVGFASENLGDLFTGDSLTAFGGPSFRWSILNYGRIENNVRVEDARFQALIGTYENTVLVAQAEVENAIAGFVGAKKQIALLNDSVTAAKRAVQVAEDQYRGGTADYTRVLTTQDSLLQEQDLLVLTRGDMLLNLIRVYRALGGGWEMRQDDEVVSRKIQEQMRQRTNWGDMIQPSSNARPATQPAAAAK